MPGEGHQLLTCYSVESQCSVSHRNILLGGKHSARPYPYPLSVYSGGTVGVLPPFLFPSVVLSRSFFCPSIPLSFPPSQFPPRIPVKRSTQGASACRPGPVFTGKGLAGLSGSHRTPASRQPEQKSPLGLSGPCVYREIYAELGIRIRRLCCSSTDSPLLYGPVCLDFVGFPASIDHSAGAGALSMTG